jgi:hypothetical protein
MTVIHKVAAIVLRGGLLLVVRKRGSSVFLSPGGKPEPGEDPAATLARELAEETGLRLVDFQPFGSFTDRSSLEADAIVHMDTLLVSADGMAEPASEIEEVAWLDSGYREDGVELGSVFDRFVVPELLERGLLRERSAPLPAEEVVLVADLDGTLVFNGTGPGPAVSAVLAELVERPGLRLVVATSRAPRGVRALLGSLSDRADLLCCNGALVVRRGGLMHRTALPGAQLAKMVHALRTADVAFCVEYGDRFVVSHDEAFPWMSYPDRSVLPRGEEPALEGAVKLAVSAAGVWLDGFRGLVGRDVELSRHASGVLDATPAGVTKAAGLAELLAGARPTVVAFGDNTNDQELLGRADAAVVVGERLPGLERAGHVHRVPASDEAVASALRQEVEYALPLHQ